MPLNRSVEELLKLASQIKEVPLKENAVVIDDSVSMFINEIHVKDGDTKVPNYFIYQEFKDWKKKNNKYQIVTYNQFFKYMSLIFTAYNINAERGYLLDESSFDLSFKNRIRARKLYDNQKKANKKKQG
jgi:hypothetical protein